MDLPPFPDYRAITFRDLPQRLWTKNKARLIERYIFLFLMITKHGTYIDGFAGPQDPDDPDSWAAKLVLELSPKWLQHFYLFELNRNSFKTLKAMADQHLSYTDKEGKQVARDVNTLKGDCNKLIVQLLKTQPIKPKEAVFCLLDQRTFECKWDTVKAIAQYKPPGEKKIEIFYFLPNGWLHRSFAGLKKNKQIATDWWGGSDPETLHRMGPEKRKELLCDRFREELGYKYVYPWPIHKMEKGKGCIMYYMIHASDHDEAPVLMERAFRQAVLPAVKEVQNELFSPEHFSTEDGPENDSLTLSS